MLWTYWLWFGSTIVASVRLRPFASRDDVIYAALKAFDAVPICDRPYEIPFERRYKIARSEIRIYPPSYN